MLKLKCIMIINVLLLSTLSIAANASMEPTIIKNGFSKMNHKDRQSAFSVWNLKISNNPSDSLLESAFLLAEQEYGKYKGYDIVDDIELSPNNRLMYIIINYSNGPLFTLFTLYYPDNDWIVSRLIASLDVKEVFPEYIWTRRK